MPCISSTVEAYTEENAWFGAWGAILSLFICAAQMAGKHWRRQSLPRSFKLKQLFPNCRLGSGSALQNGMTCERRRELACERSWRPDFIYLKLSEAGRLELPELLAKKQIPIEFGVFCLLEAVASNKRLYEHAVKSGLV